MTTIRIGGRDYPPVLSIPQCAEILNQHRSTLHAAAVAGRFPVPDAIMSSGSGPIRVSAVRLCEGLGLRYKVSDAPLRRRTNAGGVR